MLDSSRSSARKGKEKVAYKSDGMVSYLKNSNKMKLSSKNIASVRRTIVPNSSRIVPVSEWTNDPRLLLVSRFSRVSTRRSSLRCSGSLLVVLHLFLPLLPSIELQFSLVLGRHWNTKEFLKREASGRRQWRPRQDAFPFERLTCICLLALDPSSENRPPLPAPLHFWEAALWFGLWLCSSWRCCFICVLCPMCWLKGAPPRTRTLAAGVKKKIVFYVQWFSDIFTILSWQKGDRPDNGDVEPCNQPKKIVTELFMRREGLQAKHSWAGLAPQWDKLREPLHSKSYPSKQRLPP